MKPKLVLSILLSAFQLVSVKAQDIYDRGYIIKENGDSLPGYLLYNGAPGRYFQLQYKNRPNTEPMFIAPRDIACFQIADRFYVHETVDMYEPSINPYYKTIGPFIHKMKCFLQREAAGPAVDLYSYNGEKKRFFIRIKIHKDSLGGYPSLQQLIYWSPEDYISASPFERINITGYRHIDSLMVGKKGESLWYFGYRRQLTVLLNDPAEQTFIDLPYDEPHLIAAIHHINDGTNWTPPVIPREVTAKIYIAGGMVTGRAKVIDNDNNKNNASFPWRTFPIVAAGVELQAPKDFLSFCARVQLSWTRFKTGSGRMDFTNNALPYYFACDIQSVALTLAPTWMIEDEWGPFSLYMGPDFTLDHLFINTIRFGNENDEPVIDWFDPKFNKVMGTLGLFCLLRAEKYAMSVQVPLVSTKVFMGNSNYMLGKKQVAVSLSYNLFGPRAQRRKNLLWISK